MLRHVLIALAAPLALASCTTTAGAPGLQGTQLGVAAANDPRAGEIGEAIMRQGGSATDAAIAMMLALAVIEPQSSGLGGGGFLLTGSPDGTMDMFDGRETAPAAATPQWFLQDDGSPRDRGETIRSGLSVGVPGAIAVAAEAHARHGKLPWADLFQPAIAMARDGFPVTPRLSGSLASFPDRGARDPAGKAMFYGDDGIAPAAGEIVRLPALAATLEMLAQQGPDAFYSGEFADGLAAHVAADTPGEAAMTADDLANYSAIRRDVPCILYRLHKVCSVGPPSSGGFAVLAILKQVERFDLAASGLRSARTWHVVIESQRLAYADRGFYVGDPAYVDVPLEGLLDEGYLASRSALISDTTTLSIVEPGQPGGAPLALAAPEDFVENGTTHFVAVDSDGNMASFGATVEGAFGSGLVYGGFYLNNELTDFSFIPARDGDPVANRPDGGKRPASSMSPTLVFDPQGRPLFAVGAAGGGLIPMQTARAIIGVIDFSLPLEEALGLPFAMGVGENAVLVEEGTWMEELGNELQALGHAQVIPFGQLLRTTGALRTPDGWRARHDPRLDDLVRIPERAEDAPSTDAGFSEG